MSDGPGRATDHADRSTPHRRVPGSVVRSPIGPSSAPRSPTVVVAAGRARLRRHRGDARLRRDAGHRRARSTATASTSTASRARRRPGPASLHTRLSGTTSRFVTADVRPRRRRLRDRRRRPDASPPDGRRHRRAAIARGRRSTTRTGHLPVAVHASGLAGGRVAVGGDVSSQFLSGLLLSAPAMADGLEVDGRRRAEVGARTSR